MENDEQNTEQQSVETPMPKWQKWLIFFLLGVLASVVGQGLVDFKIIGNKWWLITVVTLLGYWFLFVRKPKIQVEQSITYDWNKRK